MCGGLMCLHTRRRCIRGLKMRTIILLSRCGVPDCRTALSPFCLQPRSHTPASAGGLLHDALAMRGRLRQSVA